MIAKGANPSATGNDGDTPLHFAMDFGAFEAAKELLLRGARSAAMNTAGETPAHLAPIDCARQLQCLMVVETLKHKGLDLSAEAVLESG